MIVDTSALVAVLKQEPGWEALWRKLEDDPMPLVSAATLVELYVVVDAQTTAENRRRLDSILKELGIVIQPFDRAQADVARAAYRDFGKGSGHPAHLNLGDCFSYALASVSRQPLLFVGDDFGHTDLVAA